MLARIFRYAYLVNYDYFHLLRRQGGVVYLTKKGS